MPRQLTRNAVAAITPWQCAVLGIAQTAQALTVSAKKLKKRSEANKRNYRSDINGTHKRRNVMK